MLLCSPGNNALVGTASSEGIGLAHRRQNPEDIFLEEDVRSQAISSQQDLPYISTDRTPGCKFLADMDVVQYWQRQSRKFLEGMAASHQEDSSGQEGRARYLEESRCRVHTDSLDGTAVESRNCSRSSGLTQPLAHNSIQKGRAEVFPER